MRWAISLPIMILVLVLIFGGRTARRIVAGLVCVLVLAGFFLVGVRTQSSGRVNVMNVSTPAAPGVLISQSDSYTRTAQGDERNADRATTDRFDPDTYPTISSAAVQCSRRAIQRYLEALPTDKQRPLVHLELDLDDAAQAAVTSMMAREFPSLFLVTESGPADAAESSNLVIIRVDSRSKDASSNVINAPRTVQVRISGPAGERADRALSMQKLWIEDLNGWIAMKRKEIMRDPVGVLRLSDERRVPDRYMVIDSSPLAASREEAKSRALAAAALQIEPWIRGRVGHSAPQSVLSRFTSGAARAIPLSSYLQGELARGGQIEDEFVQRFERPYGVVYRQALLLNIPDNELDRLARAYGNGMVDMRGHERRAIISAIGLIVLIILVYLFLNAATKGYYVWSLRVAGTVMIVAGVVLVLNLS